MSFLRVVASLSILATLTTLSHAFVLIDDFTVGGFTKVLTQQNYYLSQESNLDRSHVAFGTRVNYTQINSNPNNTELTIHVGGGEQAFSSPLPVAWRHDLRYGDLNFEVDFSQETEFWADLETFDPPGGFAETWEMTVMDVHGVDASNGGWLLRQDGIYFRKQAFSRQVDWSRIMYIEFTQDWNSFPNPLGYRVTKFYTIPEPGALLVLGTGLVAFLRRRRL